MPTNSFEKRSLYIFFGIVLVVALLIIKPFFSVLVISIALAAVFYPVHTWINNNLTRGVSWISAFITVVIGIAVIAIPLFFIGKMLFNESQNLYKMVAVENINGDYVENFSASINKLLPKNFHIPNEEIKNVIVRITEGLGSMFTKTISTIFSFLLVIIAFFYFLKDGDKLRKSLISLSPLSDTHDASILRKISNVINGVVKGYFLVGIVQGALLGVGFLIFGIPSPVLWGTVAAFASLMPTVGTAIVSTPAIIYLFAIGATTPAIGLLIWALVIVGLVDNLLNPFVVGKKINVPPLFILFAVLGGISLFGAVGVLVGPIVVGLLYELVSLYRESSASN